MGHLNERDILFATAGLLWGTVTLYTGLQRWLEEQKKSRPARPSSTASFSLSKSESPSMILAGAGLSLGCLAYLVWSLWT